MKWTPVKGLKKSELPKGNVIVTNNPNHVDSFGNMTNVWIARLDKQGKDYIARYMPHGVMGFVTVHNVTHYCLPEFNHP